MLQFRYLRFVCALSASLLLSAVWAAPTPAEQSLATAKQLIELRQDQQAATELQKFLTASPADKRAPEAAYLLGRCYQRQGNYDKALAAFTQALGTTKAPTEAHLRAQAYFQMGECSFAQKNLEKAVLQYGNALKFGADDADLTVRAQYWTGESLYQLSRYDQAMKAYRKVVELSPSHALAPWSYYSMGMIEMRNARYDQAITALEHVTGDYKKSEVLDEAQLALGFAYAARAQATSGNIAARESDNHKAISILLEVLDSGKVTPTAKQRATLALAQAYFDLKDYDKVETTCTKALETLDPANPLALRLTLWRGHAQYNRGKYQDAIADYTRAANSHSPEITTEGLFWLGSSWYQVAEAKKDTKDTKACAEAISAFKRFLTNVGDKHAQAPRAALLQAYCQEDLVADGDADSRSKALAAYKDILTRWPSSREATQAQNGIARLTVTMSTEELKTLVGTLPGAASWNVALRLAREEFTAGKYDAALADARTLLNGNPAAEVTAQANYLIGVAQQKLGKPTDAITSFKQVLATMPTGELAIFAQRGLAQAQLDLQHYTEARDAALALTAQKLDDKAQAEALMYLGDAYFGNQQMADAQTAYQKIVTAYPTSPLAPYAMMRIAWIADTKKDYVMATATYRDFLAKFPDHELVPQAFYRLGADLVEQKDFDNAVKAFNNVPKTHKLADQAAYAIAWTYKDQGKQDEANAQFAAIPENFPDSPLGAECLFRLGEYWLEKQHYTEAMRFYSRATDKEPQGSLAPLVLYKLGVCAFHAEQYAVAANAFGKLTANYPTNAFVGDSLFWRGQALEKQEQPATAREVYLQYVAKFANQALVLDAAVGAGRAGLTAKQYPVARADLQKALQLCADAAKGANPTLVERAKNVAPEAQYELAQCFYEEKNYADALKQFAGVSAYPYEPWYSRSMLQMARCSAQLGDRQAAQSSLQLLSRSFPKSDAVKDIPLVVKEYGLELAPAQ